MHPWVSSTGFLQWHIDNGTPRLQERVIGPVCENNPGPPVTPIRNGRAIPQPLSRKG